MVRPLPQCSTISAESASSWSAEAVNDDVRWWIGAAVCLLLIGLATRIMPLLLGGELLFRQFMTEDGYLMLTVARNIALGKGMTIADGTIPTNGVQPLATFLYAICFWIADGNRTLGVIYVHLVSIASAAVCALLIVYLARQMISGSRRKWALGLTAAGLWFAAPLILQHSMNGLETGMYFLAITIFAVLLLRWTSNSGEGLHWWRLIVLGLAAGLVFWIRNDGVFLVAAFCGIWIFVSSRNRRIRLVPRLGQATVVAAVALLIGAPWLIYNYASFGSIVPISGTAQSLFSSVGEPAELVPVKLAEHMTFLLPVPARMETWNLALAGSLLVIGIYLAGLLVAYKRFSSHLRVLILTFSLFTVALAVYYGFFFGAPYFLSRYLSAPSPIIAVGTAAGLLWSGQFLVARNFHRAVPVIASVVVAVALGLHVRLWSQAHSHAHFQAVNWVAGNVNERQWIGAIQTGTIGFFHDRTINLDGKVNPLALKARKEGKLLDYVVDSDIEYLVDWAGITSWIDHSHPGFRDNFEIEVFDPKANLGVLRRVPSVEKATPGNAIIEHDRSRLSTGCNPGCDIAFNAIAGALH